MKETIHCSIGVIENNSNYLLLRRQKSPYYNYFEFPGGKIKKNEKPIETLQRELLEELDILTEKVSFIHSITHEYKEFSVCLYVYRIIKYKGKIKSNYKQEYIYCGKDFFKKIKCLESTYRIIKLLSLPRFLSISKPNHKTLEQDLEKTKIKENFFLRFRDINGFYKNNSDKIPDISKICKKKNLSLVIDHPFEKKYYLHCDGVHYKSDFLKSIKNLPNDFKYYSCSCHNVNEIKKANLLNFDYIVISPIREAKTLDQEPLGWDQFKKFSIYANMPTFALGGVSKDDFKLSTKNKGYGVAGIRNFW